MEKDMMSYRKVKRRERGFTLVEMLVVLAILALLVSLVGPVLFKHISPAKRSVARAQINIFMSALDSYYMDTGRYPATAEGLESLRIQPAGAQGWKGPYLKKNLPKDPWGGRYIYRSPGRSGGYEIVSYGSDGEEGGEGDARDVNSWENEE